MRNNTEISFGTVLLGVALAVAAPLGMIAAGAAAAKHFQFQDRMARNAGYSFAASLCDERVYDR